MFAAVIRLLLHPTKGNLLTMACDCDKIKGMKKDVSIEEIKHIAKLSRIEFSDEECESMRSHLCNVLEYFETLDGVDVSDVPPTAHILSAVNVLRDDVPQPSMKNEELLKNAPQADGGAYIVPRVVE